MNYIAIVRNLEINQMAKSYIYMKFYSVKYCIAKNFCKHKILEKVSAVKFRKLIFGN